MSQENVEIVRQYFPAYDRGGLDALAEFWHPDINWRAAEGALDDVGLMEGPDALRHYYEQWEDTFESAGWRSRSWSTPETRSSPSYAGSGG